MGAIYLHHELQDALRPYSSAAFRQLYSILSAMSREKTWPRLSHAEAVSLNEWGEKGLDAVDELVVGGVLDCDGTTVTIGEPIAHLVRNTPPPGWEDGTLRDSLDRTEGPRGG